MTAGRRPKPTALKMLQGTVRKDRANLAEPHPPALTLGAQPPAWLRDRLARRFYKDLVALLVPMGWATVTDTTWFALLAHTFGVWRHATDVIADHGATYETETPSGSHMQRPRPEVAIAKDAMATLITLLRDAGLNPSARTKIAAVSGDRAADPATEFLDALG